MPVLVFEDELSTVTKIVIFAAISAPIVLYSISRFLQTKED